jgi:type III secretion YscU/HrpY family protein
MSKQEDSGSKTELPTPKKLRDARKKGDVPKSQDLVITVGFLFALLLMWLLVETIARDLINLMSLSLQSPGQSFHTALMKLGSQAIDVLLTISALVLVPLVLFSLAVDFLQTGPVLTIEKIKPQMSHLNPAEGVKRMFGADNLVELLKSIFRTAILFGIAFVTVKTVLGDIALLPGSDPEHIVVAIWHMVVRVVGLTAAAYILITVVDVIYQNHSFTKRMKMSLRDIRDELKETEGNPLLRGERQELGREWAQQTPVRAAQDASVLVVNPIHVAIAINYDKETAPVPVVTGKGEETIAREMRRVAAEAGVPILRNETLARALLADQTPENLVPRELFDIVAEVIIWAQATRASMDIENNATPIAVTAPGEDLTRYH